MTIAKRLLTSIPPCKLFIVNRSSIGTTILPFCDSLFLPFLLRIFLAARRSASARFAACFASLHQRRQSKHYRGEENLLREGRDVNVGLDQWKIEIVCILLTDFAYRFLILSKYQHISQLRYTRLPSLACSDKSSFRHK